MGVWGDMESRTSNRDHLAARQGAPGCKGVVTTGEGKFFSNGIDLDWMGKEENAEKVPTFMEDFQKLLARILIFPLPTVAAINGHCYAGGAVLALAHDLRVMNSQRGWMCLNEIHRNLRFSPFLLSLLRMKMNPGQTLNRALVLGQRFTAEEAVSAGLVDKSMPALLQAAEYGNMQTGSRVTVRLRHLDSDKRL
nr:hypothetical protein BaRGS_001928 [Batillaria attramentaria]